MYYWLAARHLTEKSGSNASFHVVFQPVTGLGIGGINMDTTSSLKMTAVASQSIFSHVEEENLPALRAYLDKHREVDSRSDVSQEIG